MFKKENLAFFTILTTLMLVSSLSIFGSERSDTGHSLAKRAIIGDVKYLQINNWSIPFNNAGVIAAASDGISGPLHGSGGEFPAGSDNTMMFSSGFWVSGIIDGTLYNSGVASASRVLDYTEGPVGDGRGDPENIIYEVRSNDGPGSENYIAWANAVADGAPFVDVDGNGSYDPNVDRPDLLGDQMLFYIINDGVATENRAWPNLSPKGLEIHVTAWAFARGGALGNIVFVRYRIFHKGTSPIEDMYFTSWHDPDVGNFGDDLVGCDVDLSAGFTYNSGADNVYGAAPPAFLVDFFQGPLVEAPGDTGFRVLGPNFGVEQIPNTKNLGLSSFSQYIQGDPTIGDPNNGDEARNYQLALTQQGNVFDPLTNGVGGTADSDPDFWYSGDPETGEGWIQVTARDQRMLLNTGPFRMEPGDVQDIVTAFVAGQGTDANNSVTVAKQIDALAQDVYDNNFDIAGPPPPVDVTVRSRENGSGGHSINLLWKATDAIRDRQTKAGADQVFEGFIVKQYFSSSASDEVGGKENSRIVARFDLNNTYGDLYIDGDNGRLLEFPTGTQLDSSFLAADDDAGYMQVEFTIDAATNQPFVMGSTYYFAVLGYNINLNGLVPNSNTIIADDWVAPVASDVLLNSPQVGVNLVQITPGASGNIDVAVGRPADHASGNSDASLSWEVVVPGDVTGDDYQVQYFIDSDEQSSTFGLTLWRLVNLRTGEAIIDNQSLQDGGYNFPVAEGIMVRPMAPPAQIAPSGVTFSGTDWDAGGAGSFLPIHEGPWASLNADGNNTLFSRTTNAISGGDLRRVEIRWGDQGKGYRYMRGLPGYAWFGNADTTGAGVTFGKPGEGFVDVPFTAWVVDELVGEERQLAVGFLETTGGNPDGIWDPGSNVVTSREFLFIFNGDYDPTGSQPQYQGAILDGFTLTNGTDEQIAIAGNSWFDTMYIGIMARDTSPTSTFITEGDVTVIVPNRVNTPDDIFSFSTSSMSADDTRSLQVSQFEKVNLFPNPYRAFNPQENPSAEENQFITFSHLPQKARIRIYTLSGKLVRTLDKDDLNSTLLRWDLQNESQLRVASGLYLAHIEAPDLGMQKVLKMLIVQREDSLQRF